MGELRTVMKVEVGDSVAARAVNGALLFFLLRDVLDADDKAA